MVVTNDADDHPQPNPRSNHMITFPAITHVAVTVRDLDISVPWYTVLFDAPPVLDEDTGPFRHVVWSLGSTLLGLHQFPHSGTARPFDMHQLGLDHISFACPDRATLDTWRKRLDELDIAHGGIIDASYGSGLSFRDPDNLPLEFFAPPPTTSS
jgi:glyoxylase I family protein